jgi:hypothetical protein
VLDLLELRDVELTESGPEEPDEFTGHRSSGDLTRLLGSQSVKDLEESMLALPGMRDDGRILTELSAFETGAEGGSFAVVPRGLNEDVAHPSVAGLGDGALSSALTGGMLAGREADVGHELARVLEAAYIAEFGGQDHGCLGLEAAEAGDAVDYGLVAGGEGESLDAAVEFVSALELILEKGEVLGEDRAVLIGEGAGLENAADPMEVTGGPVGSLSIDEASPAEEFEDIVT